MLDGSLQSCGLCITSSEVVHLLLWGISASPDEK